MDVDLEFILAIMILGLMILIPIIGLTARLSLKPIVEAIVRLRETSDSRSAELLLAEQRFARLEAEIQSLRALLEPVVERAEFDLKLYSESPNGTRRFPGELL
jgi:hypothetical protein